MNALRILLVMALALAGCSKRDNEGRRPTSSLHKATAYAVALHAAAAIKAQVYEVTETHSMEPILFGNIYVLAEPVQIAGVKVGDIILWRKMPGQIPRLHQVYSNNGIRLGVAGANNYSNDNTESSFITDADLVGRYVGHVVFDPATR